MLKYLDIPEKLFLKLKLLGKIETDIYNTVIIDKKDFNLKFNIKDLNGVVDSHISLLDICDDSIFHVAFNMRSMYDDLDVSRIHIARLGTYCDRFQAYLRDMSPDRSSYEISDCFNVSFHGEIILKIADYGSIVALSTNGLNMVTLEAVDVMLVLRLYKSGVFVRDVSIPLSSDDSHIYGRYLSTNKSALDLLKEMNEE